MGNVSFRNIFSEELVYIVILREDFIVVILQDLCISERSITMHSMQPNVQFVIEYLLGCNHRLYTNALEYNQ